MFELRHLREIKRIEQSFVGFWSWASARLNEKNGAWNAVVGGEISIAVEIDAALRIVFFDAFVDGSVQIAGLRFVEGGAETADDAVSGEVGPKIEISPRGRFDAEELPIDGILERMFHEIDLFLRAGFVLRFEIEVGVIVMDVEDGMGDGAQLLIVQVVGGNRRGALKGAFKFAGEGVDDGGVEFAACLDFDVVDVGVVGVVGDLRCVEVVAAVCLECGLDEEFGSRPVEPGVSCAEEPSQCIAHAEGDFFIEEFRAFFDESVGHGASAQVCLKLKERCFVGDVGGKVFIGGEKVEGGLVDGEIIA